MATDRTQNHRPLRGGIAVWPSTGQGARGTLTAVARRVGLDTKVLVTNIHVVSTSADNYTLTEGEHLYQGGTDSSDRIGKTFTYTDGTNSWLPVVSSSKYQDGEEYRNAGDITLLDVKDGVATDFGLHVDDGSGGHEQRPIVFPPVNPLPNMRVQVFGSVTGPGEARITVVDGDQEARRIAVKISDTEKIYYRFKNTVVLNRVPHPGQKGDSGAACVWEDDDGNYRMVCILYGGITTKNPRTGELRSLTGYAMPARLAESLLGIYFGVKAPTVNLGLDIKVVPGAPIYIPPTVTAVEPDATISSYRWEVVAPWPVIQAVAPFLPDLTQRNLYFNAPDHATYFELKLIVTDSNGAKASSKIRVLVNNPPTAKPGINRVVPVHTPPSLTPAVTLLGAAEDPDAGHVGDMRYSWRVDSAPGSSTRSATTGPTITLSDANVAEPTFTPTAIGDYVFTLTVKDPGDLTHSASVTIHACPANETSDWFDTGETRCHNNALQKRQTRRLSNGVIEFQWIDDPDNEVWGAWQDTSASHRNEEPGDWINRGGPSGFYNVSFQSQQRTVAYEKQQRRTSACGNTEERWIAASRRESRTKLAGRTLFRPRTPIDSQWEVRRMNNQIQVKVTSLPPVYDAIIEIRTRLESGSGSDSVTVIKAIGTTLNSWVTVLSSSDDRWSEGEWTAKIRFENDEKNSNYSATKPVTAPAVPTTPPPPVRWVDTNPLQIRGCGPTREKQQVNANNTSETRWVAAPEDLVWGELENDGEATEVTTAWEDQGSPSLFGGVCKQLQRRTATTTQNKRERNQCGGYRPAEPVVIERTDYQRVTIAETWGNWRDTGNTREHPVELIIEKEQERFSSPCNRRETRWVACAWEDVSPPETRNRVTGNWMDTGNQRENQVLLIIEKEQTRTVTWEKKQQCTGGGTDLYRWVPTSRTETRWVACAWEDVSPPETRNIVAGNWMDTGNQRENQVLLIMEKEQTRTITWEKKQQCTGGGATLYRWVPTSRTETRWRIIPEVCGSWRDVSGTTRVKTYGTYRNVVPAVYTGSGASRRRKQTRTNTREKQQSCTTNAPYNNTRYRWIATTSTTETRWVAAPVVTHSYRDITPAVYSGCGPNRRRKQECIRLGHEDTRWRSASEPDPWGRWYNTGHTRNRVVGSWTNTSTYRGCGPNRERKQTRTTTWENEQERQSHCGNVESRWVSDSSTDTQWVAAPEADPWGPWTDTGNQRENQILLIIEKQQKSTSSCGNVKYRWVAV